ncbi:hypothetical protein [uncultured Bradyrhizobium sp.]|uniref:hypothetical protein n=1 Tax=uncultured Bradyrhizobium sp. TaxID=199684 RepID=UPI00262F6F66|nr:hypothetical protein [uncultured Bradyrhizobium sp.]
MPKFITAAATIAATTSILAGLAAAFPSAANAQEVSIATSGNHYEWRLPPQYGPRTPLRAPVRVLVDADGKPVVERQLARTLGPKDGPGHWEWRAQAQYGPRAPLRPPVRTWVPDNPMAAASNSGSQK